ncbi:ABC transporter permease [Treponema sp.]|uniref:ABC transporter permease n=1 Tax=Treponema sp. TaxID=166 RepID=UPI00257B2373|nr:ABC transporter permease [Treponema sp.]MBE6353408.1 ABC transporter permease [Treponema sp.]
MNYENQTDPCSIKIDKSKFKFVQLNNTLGECKLQTKPTGYFKDAMIRFAKNRGSVICFFIIIALILYAVFAPVFSSYKISDKDGYYAYASPKCSLFENTAFWNGCSITEVNEQTFDYLNNIPGAVKKFYGTKTYSIANRPQKWFKVKIDDYAKVGWIKKLLTKEEYEAALNYEKETGRQLFYPIIDRKKIKSPVYKNDQNAWFLTDDHGFALKDDSGKVKNIFLYENNSNEKIPVMFISRMDGTQFETRVLYKEWYRYQNNKYASFLFGADNAGYDIFTRLAYGARLSLLLSICVAAINLFLGIIIGSLEGYYGGTFDLIAERIKEILYQIPSVILMTLFQLYFAKKAGPIFSMFVAFIFFGWIGTSSTVRAQFYRYKGQEYVMASRTLGAKDFRLIFRHIFPNAIGFIITTSVLTIPGVIFSEANLTYLGIVNLQSDTMTSVGTMLNGAQDALSIHPHCVFFPAAFISILLICFNEFGNGLRDAFNPVLRGSEK